MLLTDLKNRYTAHAAVYYAGSSRVAVIDAALRGLPDRLDVSGFTPTRLKTVRDAWIAADLARTTVNVYTSTVLAMFKWGVGEGFVTVETYTALRCVQALQPGRSEARDTDPVGPVHPAHIEAVLGQVAPPIAALIRLQLLTAARPGELLGLRPCDVDTSGTVWTATLGKHKEAWRGKARVLYFGPQAVEILRPLLLRPAESRIWNYSTGAYNGMILRACGRAGIAPWHPHQLRHNAATEIRATMGLEAAQVFLGHAHAQVTEIYAERNKTLAMTVAERR